MEMAPCCIKLLFANFEFLVGRFHICPVILVWPAGHESNEVLLTLALLFHVSVRKVIIDDWVLHHELIKFINNRADGGLPAQLIKNGWHELMLSLILYQTTNINVNILPCIFSKKLSDGYCSKGLGKMIDSSLGDGIKPHYFILPFFRYICCKQPLKRVREQSYLILHRNNMNLPLINNRNPKPPLKASNPLAQSAPSLEEFGLGIQVFKIQASKGIDSNHPQPRKFIKNIENPVYKQTPQPVKRTQILPSLSCEKREKAALSETDFMQRRTAIERKQPSVIVDTIKEVVQRQPLGKKISSSVQKTVKNGISEQPSLPQEQEIIQPHYRISFNELTNFYAELQQTQNENLKEIKRLRKMKENADEVLLEKAMRLRSNKGEMVQQIVEKRGFQGFFNEQIFDQYSIQAFVDGGERFRFEDEEVAIGDYDDDS